MTPADHAHLLHALRLAMGGRGRVEPNPMVGCVLVKDGVVIGQGRHEAFGGPHAEPNALADCLARGNGPRGATAYVTLEPCCHTNKKTPPCAPRLIEAGVARVVVGAVDPNPDVNGGGLAMLRQAGVSVEAAPPDLAAPFLQLIAPFRAPPFYTTLKWAESADGFVAGAGGMPVRITADAANGAVHRLRGRSSVIAVGVGTVLSDDPLLTVRGVSAARRPVRVVLDRGLRTPLAARLLQPTGEAETVIVTDIENLRPVHTIATSGDAELTAGQAPQVERLRACGAKVVGVPAGDVRAMLASSGVVPDRTHLMIEPGPRLAAATLPWADRLWVLRSSTTLDAGPSAPRAAAIPPAYVETGRLALGPDTLTEYLNRAAASFVTAAASADFVLEADGQK